MSVQLDAKIKIGRYVANWTIKKTLDAPKKYFFTKVFKNHQILGKLFVCVSVQLDGKIKIGRYVSNVFQKWLRGG